MYVKRKQESEDDINNLRVSDALYKEREKQTKRELDVINEDVDKLITYFNAAIREKTMCTMKTTEDGKLQLTHTMAYGLNQTVLKPDSNIEIPIETGSELVVFAYTINNILCIDHITVKRPLSEQNHYYFRDTYKQNSAFWVLYDRNNVDTTEPPHYESLQATYFCTPDPNCESIFSVDKQYSLVTNDAGLFAFNIYKPGDEDETILSKFVKINSVSNYDKISNLINRYSI